LNDQKHPVILNSPRIKFPIEEKRGKSIERIKEPEVKGISNILGTNLIKRDYTQFSSDKLEQ